MADDELIARYLSGDLGAFEALHDRYAGRLLGFMTSLGAAGDRAEDLAQSTWLRVIENLGTYNPRGRFRAWLFTLGRRIWLDEVRTVGRRSRFLREVPMTDEGASEIEPNPTDAGPSPLEAALEQEQKEMIEGAIGKLAPALRQTVLLRIDGKLTYAEIAEAMDCPLGTALGRARQARRKLREILCATAGEKS